MAMIPPHVAIAFGDLPQKLNEHGDDIPVPREILVRLLDLYISCGISIKTGIFRHTPT